MVAAVPLLVGLSGALGSLCPLALTLARPVSAQAPATPPVALGSLRVRGPLPRASVQEAMERSLDTYRRCLTTRQADRGRLSGELHLRVHVEANGVPIAASVDWSNVGDRPLERCLTEATEGWRLPERDAATQVSFTMRVGQGAPTGSDRDVGAVIALTEREDGHLPESARNTQTERVARARAVRRTWEPVAGGMRVSGGLSEPRVARVIRSRASALRRCLTVPPAGSSDPIAWEVLVSLRVGANGRASEEPVVQVPGAPPSAVACVAAVLRDARFPASNAATQVVARFRAAPRS